MRGKTLWMSIAAMLVAVSAFSEQERVIRIQNYLRFGVDDNIYLNSGKVDSPEIIDVLNISGKFNFSSRSDAVFSYQPEVRYRFDGDPKTITFHDLYGKLSHAMSQRTFLTLSDRLRYQQRDAQAGTVASTDDHYLNNDLLGAVSITMSSVDSVKIGGGYEFRTWDDANYGKTLGNDFDEYKTSLSYFRVLRPEVTTGMLGVDYNKTEYEGTRGSLEAVSLMTGADHTFNPNVTSFGRIGATMSTTDTSASSNDSTTPYVDAGIDYNPSERTTLNGNIGYSVFRANNSLYNSQNRLKLGVGARHDITAKISIAAMLSYVMSEYKGETAVPGYGLANIDVNDDSLMINLRGSYQINRNNFVEIGYEYTDRSIDTTGYLNEWDRNRFDIGWRLRL